MYKFSSFSQICRATAASWLTPVHEPQCLILSSAAWFHLVGLSAITIHEIWMGTFISGARTCRSQCHRGNWWGQVAFGEVSGAGSASQLSQRTQYSKTREIARQGKTKMAANGYEDYYENWHIIPPDYINLDDDCKFQWVDALFSRKRFCFGQRSNCILV